MAYAHVLQGDHVCLDKLYSRSKSKSSLQVLEVIDDLSSISD